MVNVDISEEAYEAIKHFSKVIAAVIGEDLGKVDDYADFIIKVGINKMLMDVLPDDELLRATMWAMFQDNPEYLCNFIAKTLQKGEELNAKKFRDEWLVAYR